MRLPHPLILLLACVLLAAGLTWVLPAGEYDRRDDPATGRKVVVAGTYKAVEARPVGPFRAAVAVPRGFADAVDVIGVVLFVGGAWVIVDRVGALRWMIGALVRRMRRRSLWVIPVVSTTFATLGALENMQEEIIPLIPVLLVLGRGLGFDPVTVVAMSAGAAMVGSAFGPANPFQAGIALKLAQLPLLSGGGLRLGMMVVALALWIATTIWHTTKTRVPPVHATGPTGEEPATFQSAGVLALIGLGFAAYVVGVLRFDWGLNELSGIFLVAGFAIGLIGRLGINGTTLAYLEGMQALVPAALLIGVARAISVVLADGRVIDTILHGLAQPLEHVPPTVAALLMIPFHALVHVPVPSVSGQAVLTMPVLVPLADLLHLSRQATVLAYQTGAGLTELGTPTNGALMAILLAAGVPIQRWFRFVVPAGFLMLLVGIVGMLIAIATGMP